MESSNKEGEVSSLLPQALENLLNLDLSTGRKSLKLFGKFFLLFFNFFRRRFKYSGKKLQRADRKAYSTDSRRLQIDDHFEEGREAVSSEKQNASSVHAKIRSCREAISYRSSQRGKTESGQTDCRTLVQRYFQTQIASRTGNTDGSYTKEEQVVIDELKQKMEALAKEVLEVSDRKKKSTEDWLEADKELKESTQMVEKTRKEVADLEATLFPKTSQQHPSMSEMMDTMRKRIRDCIEAERELARINHIKVVFGIRKTGQDWIKALERYGVKIAPKKMKATVVESILENPLLHQSNTN